MSACRNLRQSAVFCALSHQDSITRLLIIMSYTVTDGKGLNGRSRCGISDKTKEEDGGVIADSGRFWFRVLGSSAVGQRRAGDGRQVTRKQEQEGRRTVGRRTWPTAASASAAARDAAPEGKK